jgi:hypothetical protein
MKFNISREWILKKSMEELAADNFCIWCLEPIASTDLRGKHSLSTMHYECSMRFAAGSLAHQQGRCGCYDKTNLGPDEGPELSRREHARLACREWHRNHGIA